MPDSMPEMVWLTPFIRVPVPEDGAELRYSQEAVDQVERFFSLLVFGQNVWAGKPFVLLPWQREFIREFFGVQVKDPDEAWVRYRRFGYEEIPKKNGKSEFAAGLGLYFLLADGEQLPHVGLFATDKIQADIIYKCAKYMVEHTAMSEPKHKPLVYCRDSVREIRTRFLTDQSCFRMVFRCNGAPKVETPLTIKNSAKTRSPFITLADRGGASGAAARAAKV